MANRLAWRCPVSDRFGDYLPAENMWRALRESCLRMNAGLGDLFYESHDLESFEHSIIRLDGEFALDRDAMISLGEAYFDRYPDREKDRNSEEVRLGYRIARICITEQLLKGLSDQEKNTLRRGFRDVGALAEAVKKLTDLRSKDKRAELLDLLTTRIELIHEEVKALPKGMIRERFTGAISTSSNFLYLFRLFLAKENH